MFGFEDSDPMVVIGKALGISVVISSLMVLTSLGFMYLFSPGMSLPVPIAIILIVFAISFIASTVLLDKASDNLFAAFMGGSAVALSATIFTIALVSGAYYIINRNMITLPEPIGLDSLLTGFAICLIVSLVINRLTLKL
jgi:hypothetical protein